MNHTDIFANSYESHSERTNDGHAGFYNWFIFRCTKEDAANRIYYIEKLIFGIAISLFGLDWFGLGQIIDRFEAFLVNE